jgi:hypothetical protein
MSKENIERLRAKRGGHRSVITKLEKEAIEHLQSTDIDTERCKIISNQLEDKMKILNDINEEILGVCEVNEIGKEIEDAAIITDRILNTKSKIEAAINTQNTGNINVVASPNASVESQNENSPDTIETANTNGNTGNLATSSENSVTNSSVNNTSNTSNIGNINTSNASASYTHTNTNLSNASAPISPVPASFTMPKLPKLELPKFSGKVTEWSSFWDLYNTAIHSNASMSKVNKFNYLFSLLEGNAARSIKGLTLTSANYDAAIEILHERFGKSQQIIAAHMDQILQISACLDGRTTQLRSVYDKISVHVRGLASLGVAADQYGSLLIPVIMSKLPSEIRLQVARKATSDVWKIDELLDTIKFEVEAREMSEMTRSNASEKPPNKPRPPGNTHPTVGSFIANDRDGASFKVKCAYCHEFHYSASCEKVTDRDARMKLLRDSKRCFVCLRIGHNANKCDSTKKCRHCSGRHHQSICPSNSDRSHSNHPPSNQHQQVDRTKTTESSHNSSEVSEATRNNPTTTAVTQTTKGSVLLQTARAVVSNGSRSVSARILFDTGSQRSYVRKSLQTQLRLKPIAKETLQLNTFGESKSKRENCEVFKLNIANKNGRGSTEIRAIGFPTICAPLPSKVNVGEYSHLDGLDLADFDSGDEGNNSDSIDILVGADHYWDIVTGDVIHGRNGPTAVNSKLGWLLSGWSKQPSSVDSTVSNLILAGERLDSSNTITDHDELVSSLRRFWETESIGIDSSESEISPKEQDFVPNIKFTGTRYEVSLPWKDNRPDIDDDYELCRNRLKSLHQKLLKDPKHLEEYNRNIQEQLATGIVEEVPPTERDDKCIHYLPHHCVIRSDKVTTKLRVVYDGSATTETRNYSINDCLLTGPNLIPQIFDLLVKFRQNPVGLVADIEKAFLMIGISEEDRDMLRFLWLKDAKDPHSEILKLRFCRLVFGLRSSPAVLGATIQQHLKTHERDNPEVVEHLRKSLYVDDFVSGAENDERALDIYKGSKQIMCSGGFNLRKWSSNSDNLIKCIDVLEGGSEATSTEPKQVMVLGMAWDTADDTFLFNLEELIEYAKSLPVTKRSLLRWSSKIFDPLGFLSPFTIRLKILFQMMCMNKIDWDGELQGDLRKQWDTLISELKYVREVRVSRCYFLMNFSRLITQIHGFSDASERAIGAVVYTRTVYETGRIDTKLLASKTRVAPVKSQTIPRLELIGATLLARLVNSVVSALEWNVEIFCWVDSMTTLHWIRNDRPWKQYVQHRVNEIRNLSSVNVWRFCPGSLNPADLPSRGISAQELSNESLWFNGPDFLSKGEDEWPKCPVANQGESDEVLKEVVKQPSNVVRSLVTRNDGQYNVLDLRKIMDINRFSSLKKLLRVTAYVLRFIEALKTKKQDQPPTVQTMKQPTGSEIKQAELLWTKSIQATSFENEISFVSSKDSKSIEPIYVKQFGLYLDDDQLLRCKGRLNNASLNPGSKNPILLPSKSPFVELLIRDVHDQVKHSGVRDTLTTIRERYWVIRGREATKRIIKRCVICRKAEGSPYGATTPPDLPASRVSEAPPFTNVGLDFAGPLFVREGHDKEGSSENSIKVYVLLFTCASTRAVHLELTPSLSVPAFLRAFRRYASRRGLPALLISDNAKTFRASCAEIRKLCRAEEVLRYLTDNQITWQFIVEKAPWWGGFWERLIRSVKRPLRRVIGRANLTYDELQTLVVEIEGLINARPITYMYDDTESISFPLSPSHLVYGRRITTMPNSEHYEIVSTYKSLTRKAKHHRNLLERFTKQWRNEYLLALRERASIKTRGNRNPDIAVGDIVIIRNDQTKRNFWKLAKVEELLCGEDGVARAAIVRVLRENSDHSQLLRRSIQHLIPIEVRHEGATNVDEATNADQEHPRVQVLRPTKRPQRTAATTGQLRRLQDMGKL